MKVDIYTDGSGTPGLGSGGWAFIVADSQGGAGFRASGCVAGTTNNRMELTAIIEAVNSQPPHVDIVIHTDSEWCINCISGVYTPKKNLDLFREYQALARGRRGTVNFVKVAAHSGDYLNDLADKLAGAARKGVVV